ncbi:MAG: CapA family protein, partial [Clostridia bacterium]|nr:CapA family protein [Clostridia bacterium]
MAKDRDELYTRHEKREALRKKRQQEQRKMVFGLLAAVLILVCVIVGIVVISKDAGKKAAHAEGMDAAGITEPSQTTRDTEPTETTKARRDPLTTIHIKAAGDLNVTTSVVDAGLAASGFDFTNAFMDVAPILSDADLTILNLEGNICGEPYGSASTSAPRELLEGLRSAGVDLVQMANSCSINNGLIGMTTTLQAVRAAGIEPVGAFASEAELKRSGGYTIMEVQGIKIAFVAFTKGVGGMGMPAGNEDLVNLLYTDYSSTYLKIDRDRINKTLDRVNAERPDIVIAMLHWG